MGCGSSQHKIGACLRRKSGYRPPIPKGYGKQKSVRVFAVENAPLPFGREGDVDDDPEYIVDYYMASMLSLEPSANVGVKAGADEEMDQ